MIEIDALSADALSLAQAAKLFPVGRRGSRPHLSTLIRWIEIGSPARDGTRVRLSAIRCGGRWLTSRAAIHEFCARLTAKVEPFAPPAPTPAQRRRADQATADELSEIGL